MRQLMDPWVPAPGRRPMCRIELRDAPAGSTAVGAVDREFPDLVDRYLTRRQRARRRLAVAGGSWRWRRERTTAAAVSLIAPDPSPSRGARTRHIEECLRLLSLYLGALGMATNDPLVGEFTLGDIASSVEFVSEMRNPLGRSHSREHSRVGVHLWERQVMGLPRDPRKIEDAAILFRAGREGEEIAYPVVALRHAATRELLAGRRDYAILLFTSSVEVLVDLTITRAWSVLGLPQVQLSEARDAPLVNKLATAQKVMFPSAAPLASAIDTWLRDCYDPRKRIIHSAHAPTQDECSSAATATYDLIAAFGAAIDADARTKGTVGNLPTSRFRNERYADVDWSSLGLSADRNA